MKTQTDKTETASASQNCAHNDREWRGGNWTCTECGDVQRTASERQQTCIDGAYKANTERLKALRKRTIPAEKPTKQDLDQLAMAKEILALQAHADNLAEALREIVEHPYWKGISIKATQALAAYGTFAVANESEVRS